MADYRRDLAAWEAEKTRQQYEFTINDPNAVSIMLFNISLFPLRHTYVLHRRLKQLIKMYAVHIHVHVQSAGRQTNGEKEA